MCIKSTSVSGNSYTINMKLHTTVILIVGVLSLIFLDEASSLPTTDLRNKREVANCCYSRRQKRDICVDIDSNEEIVFGSDYMDTVSSPDQRQKRDICIDSNEDYTIIEQQGTDYAHGIGAPESGDYGDYPEILDDQGKIIENRLANNGNRKYGSDYDDYPNYPNPYPSPTLGKDGRHENNGNRHIFPIPVCCMENGVCARTCIGLLGSTDCCNQ